MFQKHDISRNACMLTRGQANCGYDWWWHSFTGRHAVTGEEKPFFIEFFLCNPKHGGEKPSSSPNCEQNIFVIVFVFSGHCISLKKKKVPSRQISSTGSSPETS